MSRLAISRAVNRVSRLWERTGRRFLDQIPPPNDSLFAGSLHVAAVNRTQIYRTGDSIRSLTISPGSPRVAELLFHDVNPANVAAAVEGLRRPSRRSPVFYSSRYTVATLALAHDDIVAAMPDSGVTETLADIALDRLSPMSYRLLALESEAVRTTVEEKDPAIVQQWSSAFIKYRSRRQFPALEPYDLERDPARDLINPPQPPSPEELGRLSRTALEFSVLSGLVFSAPADALAFSLPLEAWKKGLILVAFPLLIAAAGYYPILSLLTPKEPLPASRRIELLTRKTGIYAGQIAELDGAITENRDPERMAPLVKIRAALEARRAKFQETLDGLQI